MSKSIDFMGMEIPYREPTPLETELKRISVGQIKFELNEEIQSLIAMAIDDEADDKEKEIAMIHLMVISEAQEDIDGISA